VAAARRPRLLIDQNLSPRLADLLSDVFPLSTHVLHVGLDEARDQQVRAYAEIGGFTILTKDADHAALARYGPAEPRVIWLRLGNCSTSAVEALMRAHLKSIDELQAGLRGPVLMLP
jgi:predicted nuclease of predicted toxin-antitoxin system